MQRKYQALTISKGNFKPIFKNLHISSDWKINDLPNRLQNRKLDLGDCSPSNVFHLIDALNSDAQGIQVDFDDGFCPTWFNTILGLYNVCMASRSKLKGMLHEVENCPLLLMRPRAFNMIEHHCMVCYTINERNSITFSFYTHSNRSMDVKCLERSLILRC